MDQDVKLSVAIIAKNEEGVINECLESVKEADEIVVVDTGSEDQTVEISKSYGAKCWSYTWDDNFSNAYNFASRHCSHPWILSIDADERLLSQVVDIKGYLKQLNHAYSDVKIDYDASWHYAPKLYKNNDFVKWMGPVHKYLNVWDRWNKGPVELYAFRSRSHAKDPDRSLRMLLDTIQKDMNPRYLFYLGMEYAARHQWDEAIQWLDQFLSRPYKKCYKTEANLMLGKVYRQKGQYINARDYAIRSYYINKEFAEASDFLAFLSHGRERKEWLARRDAATGDDVLFYRKGKWLS